MNLDKLNKPVRISIAITLLAILVHKRSFAQADVAAELASQLTIYSQQHYQEKIFVHTDKSFYVGGEIIWFRLYNTDALMNRYSTISKAAYVEILNQDHQPVLQAKIDLQEGKGTGSFMLPFSIVSGTYTFRAYTNWMKNFSADLFFEKPIHIINTLKKAAVSLSKEENISLQFFPESGNLVNNLKSKVAFHAVDHRGKGWACSGIITNQRGDTIQSFFSGKFGMGHFYLTPKPGERYKARVRYADGEKEFDLPVAYENGYTLELVSRDEQSIRINARAPGHGNETVYLLGHTRQVMKFAEGKKLTGTETSFIINRNDLGEGVSHFTLFNDKRQPVCERLFFQPPAAQLEVDLVTSDTTFSTRKKVNIDLISTIGGAKADADFSISVYKIDSLQQVDEEDIRSYFWLSSAVKGRIESPAYYFLRGDTAVAKAADDLMLTQGWSRFRWEDVTQSNKPLFQFLPEYEGMLISANAFSQHTNLPVANAKAFLSIPGQRFIFRSARSDAGGRLIFNTDRFYGTTDIVLQGSGAAGEPLRLSLLAPYSIQFSSRKYATPGVTPEIRQQLTAYSVNTQVENSYVRDKKLVFYFPESTDTSAFFGKPDKTYMLDDYTRFITLEEVMREYITEVRVRKTDNRFNFRVRNKPVNDFFDRDPLILLDGLPVTDVNKLMQFDPLKIKRIDLLTRKYFSGNDVIDGIVSYSTYKGNPEGYALDPGAVVIDYPGLQLQREFYSPQYDSEELLRSPLPDFRNLLYWSPDITTKGGKSSVSFYTSDRPGRYAVVVQGMNNAAVGSKAVFFDVRK